MQKVFVWSAIAALAAAAPAFAEASGFSWSYVDAGYVTTHLEDADVDGDGFAIDGSIGLTDQLHIIASYSKQDFDFFGNNSLKAKNYSFGAGLNWPLNPNLDIETHASYLKTDVDSRFGGASDNGLDIGLDLRGRLGARWELEGGVSYSSFDDSGDDTSLHFGARFFVAPRFAITADLSGNDDGSSVFIGGRLILGR